jgi:hypothetical protein
LCATLALPQPEATNANSSVSVTSSARFVEHYNHTRSHESLQNLTIKRDTIKLRRLQHQWKAS